MHRRRAAGVLLVGLTVGLTTQPAAAASGWGSRRVLEPRAAATREPKTSAARSEFEARRVAP